MDEDIRPAWSRHPQLGRHRGLTRCEGRAEKGTELGRLLAADHFAHELAEHLTAGDRAHLALGGGQDTLLLPPRPPFILIYIDVQSCSARKDTCRLQPPEPRNHVPPYSSDADADAMMNIELARQLSPSTAESNQPGLLS
eukprot:jgi/Mesvir1/11189/Mv25488-RA.1